MKNIYEVEDIHCAGCVNKIEKVLKDNNINSKINLLTKTAELEYDNINSKELEKILKSTGYTFKKNKNSHFVKKKIPFYLIVSIIVTIIIMTISMGDMFLNFVNENNYYIFTSLQFLFLIINIYISRSMFKKAITSLNMYSLITIGVVSSILYSFYLIFINEYKHIYFETASVILTLELLGNYLENIAKYKTSESLYDLINMKSNKIRILSSGIEKDVDIKEVNINDIMILKTGENISLDAEIIEGYCYVDESIITGESKIIEKVKGDKLISGSILKQGYIKAKVLSTNENSTFTKLIDSIQSAINTKPKITRVADKISKYFIQVVIIFAVLNAIYGYFLGYSFEKIFVHFISILVIACPCAIGLAIPTVITVAFMKASKKNILIKNSEIFEKFKTIDNILLDKTGTVTKGKMEIKNFILDEKYVNELYYLEKKSEHVLAKPIIKYIEKNYDIEKDLKIDNNNFKIETGFGIKSDNMYIGNIKYMEKNNIILNYEKEYEKFSKEGDTTIFVAYNNEVVGIISIGDEIREDSRKSVTKLIEMGYNVYIVTGDNENVANYISEKLGIKNVYANCTPYMKYEIVEKMQKENKKVIMVGDGVNDSLSLSSADISLAIGSGSDIAINTSDVILLNSSINDIILLSNISKVAMRYIYQNLIWAFVYNVVGILLASGLLSITLNPMIAAIIMMFSSLSVMINALRMKI